MDLLNVPYFADLWDIELHTLEEKSNSQLIPWKKQTLNWTYKLHRGFYLKAVGQIHVYLDGVQSYNLSKALR